MSSPTGYTSICTTMFSRLRRKPGSRALSSGSGSWCGSRGTRFAVIEMPMPGSCPREKNPAKRLWWPPAAALGAWVALMIAGMIEYNFGDSEVLTFFLFIASAPYAFMQ